MSKTFFMAAILLAVLAQACFSQPRGTATGIDPTKHVMAVNDGRIWDGRIWFENTTISGWPALTAPGGAISLYLDETNPVFFALVCNIIKDSLINKKICYVSTDPASGHNGYAKIVSIYLQ